MVLLRTAGHPSPGHGVRPTEAEQVTVEVDEFPRLIAAVEEAGGVTQELRQVEGRKVENTQQRLGFPASPCKCLCEEILNGLLHLCIRVHLQPNPFQEPPSHLREDRVKLGCGDEVEDSARTINYARELKWMRGPQEQLARPKVLLTAFPPVGCC